MPESAYGPTNNCIGIGRVLRQRGHRVVFVAEASWRGKLAALGFEEVLVDLAPPAGDSETQDAGQFWKDFIRDTAQEFRRPTIEQLETFMAPTWQALIDGARFCEPRLREIIADVKPDVVVQDNVVCFPALMTSGVPFVRIVSCNPLEVRGPDGPPPYSGLGSDDQDVWIQFRSEYERTHRPV
jgi:UDP:flavonoid glycosyltransferase YjiC (YdhE family)